MTDTPITILELYTEILSYLVDDAAGNVLILLRVDVRTGMIVRKMLMRGEGRKSPEEALAVFRSRCMIEGNLAFISKPGYGFGTDDGYLQWILDNAFSLKSIDFQIVVKNSAKKSSNSTKLLEWMHKEHHQFFIMEVMYSDDVELFLKLLDMETPSDRFFGVAMQLGAVEIADYLVGSTGDDLMFEFRRSYFANQAAKRGLLPIAEFAYHHGCYFEDQQTYLEAAKFDDDDHLRFLLANDFVIDKEDTITEAIRNDSLKVLEYIRTNFTLEQDWILTAIERRRPAVVRWFITNGITREREVMEEVAITALEYVQRLITQSPAHLDIDNLRENVVAAEEVLDIIQGTL